LGEFFGKYFLGGFFREDLLGGFFERNYLVEINKELMFWEDSLGRIFGEELLFVKILG
jgi:hypothetical protein